mmetsp:Transcript_41/g.138  ORF Transcript_41/g.138 Transcript_41/m.138 type:complete len:266 (-) Transcript_41:734-1531(-)
MTRDLSGGRVLGIDVIVLGVVKQELAKNLELLSTAVGTNAGTTESREPKESVEEGASKGKVKNLADGATLRDTSNEGADESSPCSPPSPVKDGPVIHPSSVGTETCVVIAIETTAVTACKLAPSIGGKVDLKDGLLKVPTNALYKNVENVSSVVKKSDEEPKDATKQESESREDLDTNVKTRDDRNGGNETDNPNHNHLNSGSTIVIGNIERSKTAKTGSHLNSTKTERCTDTSNDDNDAESVNGITPEAPGVVTKDRMNTGTHG